MREGFQNGKTLWDWIQLAVAPVAIAFATTIISRIERNRTEELARRQAESDQRLADQKARDVVLDKYLERMDRLLIESKLRDQPDKSPLWDMARAWTASTAERLDAHHLRALLAFLTDAELLDFGLPTAPTHLRELTLYLSGRVLEDIKLERVRLHGLRLIGTTLRDVGLSEAALNQAKCAGATFERVSLYRAVLRDVDVSTATLIDTNLAGAQLEGSSFSTFKLPDDSYATRLMPRDELLRLVRRAPKARLRGVSLEQATLTACNFAGVDLRDTVLTGAKLGSANLVGAQISVEQLRSVENLERTGLRGIDLSAQNCAAIKFAGALLVQALLRKADCADADFRDAYLIEADLREAGLERADLRGARLERADLRGARLERADLRGANLERADLRGARLEKADFTGANLRGALVNSAQLSLAIVDGSTRF